MTAPATRGMSPALGWILGVVLVVVAGTLSTFKPGADFVQQPFPVDAALGEPAEGRNLRLTVLEVSGASELSDEHGWRGDGPWLLVEFEAAATRDEEAANLARIELHIGDRTFRASDRPLHAAPRGTLSIDLPATATAAFELPADALEQRAVVEFGFDSDDRLDSEIRHEIDLADIPFDQPAVIPDRTWSR